MRKEMAYEVDLSPFSRGLGESRWRVEGGAAQRCASPRPNWSRRPRNRFLPCRSTSQYASPPLSTKDHPTLSKKRRRYTTSEERKSHSIHSRKNLCDSPHIRAAMAVPPETINTTTTTTTRSSAPNSSHAGDNHSNLNQQPTSSRKPPSNTPVSIPPLTLNHSLTKRTNHGKLTPLPKPDRLPTIAASEAFRDLSEDDNHPPSNVYTGITELDDALGGGFESGKVTELWGPPGAGKTAIAYVASSSSSSSSPISFSAPKWRN